MADDAPPTFENVFDDSPPSSEEEEMSMFNAYKRFHVPGRGVRREVEKPPVPPKPIRPGQSDVTDSNISVDYDEKKTSLVEEPLEDHSEVNEGNLTVENNMLEVPTDNDADSTDSNSNQYDGKESINIPEFHVDETVDTASLDRDDIGTLETQGMRSLLISDTMMQDVDTYLHEIGREPLESFVIIPEIYDPNIHTDNEPNKVSKECDFEERARAGSSSNEDEFSTPKQTLSDDDDNGPQSLPDKQQIVSNSSIGEESLAPSFVEIPTESTTGAYKSISSSISESEVKSVNMVKENIAESDDYEQFTTSLQDTEQAPLDDPCHASVKDKIKMMHFKMNAAAESETSARRAKSESPVVIRKEWKNETTAENTITKSDSFPHLAPPKPFLKPDEAIKLPQNIKSDHELDNPANIQAASQILKPVESLDKEPIVLTGPNIRMDAVIAQLNQEQVTTEGTMIDKRNEAKLNENKIIEVNEVKLILEKDENDFKSDINKIQESVIVVEVPPPIQPKSQAVLDSIGHFREDKVEEPPPIQPKSQAVLDSIGYFREDKVDEPPPIQPKSQAVLDSIGYLREDKALLAGAQESVMPPQLPSRCMPIQEIHPEAAAQRTDGENVHGNEYYNIPDEIAMVDSERNCATPVKHEDMDIPEGQHKHTEPDPMVLSPESHGAMPGHQFPPSVPQYHGEAFPPGQFGPQYGVMPPFPPESNMYTYGMMDEHGYMVPQYYPQYGHPMMYSGPFPNQQMGTPGYGGFQPDYGGMAHDVAPEQLDPVYADNGSDFYGYIHAMPSAAHVRQDHHHSQHVEQPAAESESKDNTVEHQRTSLPTNVRRSMEPSHNQPAQHLGPGGDGFDRKQEVKSTLLQAQSTVQQANKDPSPVRRTRPMTQQAGHMSGDYSHTKAAGKDQVIKGNVSTAQKGREQPDQSPARTQPMTRQSGHMSGDNTYTKATGRDRVSKENTTTTQKGREKPATQQRTRSERQKQDESMAAKKKQVTEKRDYYIYVDGINTTSGGENISNFVEAGANAAVREDGIIFNLDHTAALVTFSEKPDFAALKQRVSSKQLDSQKLKVFEVSPPTSLAVSSEQTIRSTDNLTYYFEREKIGGGDIKSKVSQSKDGSCYVIEFKDSNVVTRLCSKQNHEVDKVALRVSPYFTCSAGAIWDAKLHTIPIPDPIHVDLPEEVVQFLQRPCCKNLTSLLKQKHVDPRISQDGATLVCTLTAKTPNLKELVNKWRSEAETTFQEYLDKNVQVMKLEDVSEQVWPELTRFRKSGDVDKENILIMEDAANRKFVITGCPSQVQQAFNILKQKSSQIDRRLSRKTEKKQFKSSLRLRLLEHMNVISDVKEKFADVLIHTDHRTVTIEGVPEEIQEAFLQILQADMANEETNFLHDYSKESVDFLAKEPFLTHHINKEHEKEKLRSEWEVKYDGISIVCAPRVDPQRVVNVIRGCLTEVKIPIETAASGLFRENWEHFSKDVMEMCQNQASVWHTSPDIVLVFGLKQTTQKIVKKINDFLETITIRQELIQCDKIKLKFAKMHMPNMCSEIEDRLQVGKVRVNLKDNGFEVSGTTSGMEMAKRDVKSEIKKIISEPHTMKMVDVRNVFTAELDKGTIQSTEVSTRCLIHQPGDDENEGAYSRTSTYGATASGGTSRHYGATAAHVQDEPLYEDLDDVSTRDRARPKSTKKFRVRNGAEVTLVKGEIGKLDGDVMVVTTAPSLNLKSGASSRSILKEAGDTLQKDCTAKYPKQIKPGQLAEIPVRPCQLECKTLYLTSLPEWTANGKTILEQFMMECLEKASKDGKYSILICAMGTGKLGYPKDMVAMVMYQAVIDFGNKHSSSSLKDIRFVLYQKDMETIQAFEAEERRLLQGGTRQKFDMTIGKVKIDLVIENLAEQKVDAILCTTNAKMDLERSGACVALVKLGGPSLKADCASKHNNSLAAGQVVEITGGKLRSQSVFLTVLPPYTQEAEAFLKKAIQQALSLAQGKKYKSLAIPALGTGYLKYPANVACACMYEAVEEWEAKNPNTCLQTVKFVMYAKDHQLIQTFKAHVRRSQSKGSRKDRRLDNTPSNTGGKTSQKYNATHDGCHIGNIFLKVKSGNVVNEKADGIVNSVTKDFKFLGAVAVSIMKACGSQLETECEQNKNKMRKEGVVRTDNYGLSAGCIIHVAFQQNLGDWQKKMLKCLEKAHKYKLKSLAFPVLGTGGGKMSFTADSIAGCLFEAINDFVTSNPQSQLRDVRLVVFHKQPELMQPVIQALHKKTDEAIGVENKFFGKFRKKVGEAISSTLFGSDPEAGLKTPEELKKTREAMSSITVHIYSDDPANIQRCKAELDNKLQDKYTTQKLDHYRELVKTMTQAEANKLMEMSYLVDIKADLNAGIFTIKGPMANVLNAMDYLHTQLRRLEKGKQEEKEADTLYKVIVWHYEDIKDAGIEHVPYDKMSNRLLEKAYKDNRGTVELFDKKSNRTFVIDFGKLEEYPKDDQLDVAKILRKNILTSTALTLPNTWAKMNATENVKPVTLQPTDPEYKSVETAFVKQVKTGPFSHLYNSTNLKILKIERIQNRTLYQQYAAQRKQLQNEKPNLPANMPIERVVWHGTNQNVLSSIITYGFNRSYCESNTGKGKNYWGFGVYFAADASYSARAWMSAGASGGLASGFKGSMFMVKALTGEFVKGVKDMRYLPPKNASNPSVLYDSAVDDVNNPMEFVIFHDSAAYPEYTVSFSM